MSGTACDRREYGHNRPGFALVTVIIMITVMSVLLAAFGTLTQHELASVRATADGASGFYSAEAGLNVRGELVRAVFQGYERPSGTSPDPEDACAGANMGDGDFACRTFGFNSRRITTYVVEDPRNNNPDDAERMITIPSGERFAGLNAIQYRYSVVSEASPRTEDRPEAILEMVFRTRLVPLFQFAAFYDKDLEVLPGADMTLGGPVHVNGDLYLNNNGGSNGLHLTGSITVSKFSETVGGGLWRGRKNANECAGTVRANDANSATNPDPALTCTGGSRRLVPQSELDNWNGRIETGIERLVVPEPEEFGPGGRYWREADVIIALDVRTGASNPRVFVPNRDFTGGVENITRNAALTTTLNTCTGSATRLYPTSGAVGGSGNPPATVPALPNLSGSQLAVEHSNRFRDRREDGNTGTAYNSHRVMLEVDVRALMQCLDSNASLFDDGPSTERNISDTSGGGLVWYFTVIGPRSESASSGYGVRLRNGAFLGINTSSGRQIKGLTIVSDQAVFIQGNFNYSATASHWRPAAVMADALNVLSNNFSTTWDAHRSSMQAGNDTYVQAAFMSGTQTTGGTEGTAGQGGGYNGGLENYPVLHENWGGSPQKRLFYRGSFVSLDRPKHSTGAWIYGSPYYEAPIRDWGYDTRFNNVNNLPPLAPRFVYLLQERFVREFNR